MIEEEIKITGNTSEAQKSFEDLGKVIAEQKQITVEFEKELLEACGIELNLLDSENRDKLREHDNYSDICTLFTNVWKHR